MTHLPNLIIDLALILGAAAVVTFLFKWLKQPLVLGYLLAGFLVGPYFDFFPSVRDRESISIWAEIGVIFLLFSLGLEFSFKKLLKVGSSASITAVVEVVVMLGLGYLAGQLMGWSLMDSLFLAGILSISSTTIIIKALDELGLKTKQFASLVFGVLIVEDLVAIFLMILLTTLAVSREIEGTEILNTILKLFLFLFSWFALGIFFIPTLLRKARKLISDEMLLIFSLALCLGMVVFASEIGFSAALGAFIMGSILAETTKAEKIEHLTMPVKDLFGAIFFVSVGMLLDPQVLVDYALPIVILCVVTVLGKILSSSMGALLSGQQLQTSIQAGFSLAQIGEFSFIIATLGISLGVTSHFVYPITVAVSAVTTLTTPYLIQLSGPFYRWLSRRLPEKMVKSLNRYHTETRQVSKTSEWKVYLKKTLINTIFLSVIIVAIILAVGNYVIPMLDTGENLLTYRMILVALTLLVLSPFLWALAVRIPVDAYRAIVEKGHNPGIFLIVRIFKLSLAAVFIGFLLTRVFNWWTGLIFTVVVIALLIMFSKWIRKLYARLESRFFTNLNQREMAEEESTRSELAPWNAHLVPVKVPGDSGSVGRSLMDLQWREKIGVNVVLIKRDEVQIAAPGKEQVLYPGDELLVLGTDMQVQKLKAVIRPREEKNEAENVEVELLQFSIEPGSPLAGKTIRESGFRTEAKALVVGIERGSERNLNPESDFVLQPGDVVFVVGNRKQVRQWAVGRR